LSNFDEYFYVQNVPANQRYQIHLRSQAGPIFVLLVNKDSDSSSPVVVQVPPAKPGESTMPVNSTNMGQKVGVQSAHFFAVTIFENGL
jgi:hypothetical protein